MLDGNDNRDDDRPGVDEIYERAVNATNLKQEPERRTNADVLRDMAMSASRLGNALLRLRSQWEISTKPERQVPRTVKQFMAILGDKEKALDAHSEECSRCDASYENALNTLARRIDGLAAVREELTSVAVKWGFGKPADPITRAERSEQREVNARALKEKAKAVEEAPDEAFKMLALAELNYWTIEERRCLAAEEAEDRLRAQLKVGAVIRYWLSQSCPRCDGLKFQVQAGTARLSTKMCPPEAQGGCGGTGYVAVPHQQEGRRLANHMDHCVHRYRQTLGSRRAMSALPLIDRIPLGMRRAQNVKGAQGGLDPEAD